MCVCGGGLLRFAPAVKVTPEIVLAAEEEPVLMLPELEVVKDERPVMVSAK